MERKIGYLLLSVITISMALAAASYSQDTQSPTSPAQAVKEEVAEAMKAEESSVYGEVQSVDTQGAGSLMVQYYDYDTDEDRSINIAADADTKIENVGSVSEIKKGDWADISYSVVDGKNIARSIIVEKEEGPAPAATEEAAALAPAQDD
jgi:hypothetical protein